MDAEILCGEKAEKSAKMGIRSKFVSHCSPVVHIDLKKQAYTMLCKKQGGAVYEFSNEDADGT